MTTFKSEYLNKIPFMQAKSYSSRGSNKIIGIAIHGTNDNGATALQIAQYFQRSTSGSAEYVIGQNGEGYRCLNPDQSAWAVGTNYGEYEQKHEVLRNANTVSIEMCPAKDGTYTDECRETVKRLVHELMTEYDIRTIDYVVRHYDITNKACPVGMVNSAIVKGTDLLAVDEVEKYISVEWLKFKGYIFDVDWHTLEPNMLYYVGTDWERETCIGQKGIYRVYENAVDMYEKNYPSCKIFDMYGNIMKEPESEPVKEEPAKTETSETANPVVDWIYKDVSNYSSYYEAVKGVVEAELMKPKSDTEFGVDDPITKGELAVAINNVKNMMVAFANALARRLGG